MWGWYDRPTKAEVKHLIGGDAPARVVTVGFDQFEVTIPNDPEGEVTFRKPDRRYSSDPRQAFPNMEVRDGALTLPLEDVVGAILSRVKPEEIAVALWANDEVRALFVEAMSERYSEMNVGDADRRAWLDAVKEAVHSAALDKLAAKMASMEYEETRRWSFHTEISRINDTLYALDVRHGAPGEDGEVPRVRFRDMTNSGEYSIGGKAWNEARDHWRTEVAKLFPGVA